MEDLRCVRYDDANAILDAIEAYDDGFMNQCTGDLLDYIHNAKPTDSPDAAYFYALYRGEDLLLTLTHHAHSRAWRTVCPQRAENLLTPSFLDTAIPLLAATLFEAAHPSVVSSVSGHAGAVNTFLEAWAALAATKDIHLRIAEPVMTTHSSYATRNTLPALPDAPSPFTITLSTEHDFESVFPLFLDFVSTGAGLRGLDVEEAFLRGNIAAGLLWICRDEGATAGFILIGRASSRGIAIRNVYVSPDHRRKGIAGAMVRAMTRYHLGVQPVGYEGVPAGPPPTGVKNVVCINVADAAVERIYRRAGFLFPEYAEDGSLQGGLDPVTGQKAWFPSMWRGFQPQSAP